MERAAADPGSSRRDRRSWELVQAELSSIEGDEGIRRRAEAYAPYFQRFGAGVRILPCCHFSSPWRIVLDDGAGINRNAIIEGSSGVRIGRNARIGHRVLIHSANHLTGDGDGLAFFEQGYAYLPVSIGDNVLISANVTILPGARIGAGAFVAAGAVVTAGDWPEATRLLGVPARARAGRVVKPDPRALVVVRAPPDALAAARRLVAVLGMPQVRAQSHADPLPPGVGAVIDLADDAPAVAPDLVRWRIAPPDALRAEEAMHGRRPQLPREVRRTRVRNGFGEVPSLASCATATLYAAWNHGNKQPAVYRRSAGDRLRWLVLPLLRDLAPPAERAGWDRLLASLGEGMPAAKGGGEGHRVALVPEAFRQSECDALVAERVAGLSPALAQAFSEPAIGKPVAVRAALLSAPEMLPPLVLRLMPSHREHCETLLDLLLPHANTAERLASVGVAALLAGQPARNEAIAARLADREWCVDGGSAVLSARGSHAVSRSPLVGACLAAAALSRSPECDLVIRETTVARLDWHAIDTSGDLIDRERRLISPSLLAGWRALVAPPAIEQGHAQIDEGHYSDPAGDVEAIWAEIAVAAVHAAGATAVRVLPWPTGCRWALALRLDVDRATPAATINALLDVQRTRLRSAAGSWYFIPGAAHNDAVRNVLRHWNQEHGLHATFAGETARDEASPPGIGVTMHSSNRSEYWRGRPTLEGARRVGARYAESMVSMHRLPHLDEGGAAAPPLWLTPLHFPLEGSTAETDTSYFWHRAAALRRQIARGGLVIVGSHPDCNPAILDRALAEMGAEGAWCATVGEVVERVARLHGPDALTASEEAGEITLTPRHCVADVTVETLAPGESAWQAWRIQLQAGAPRRLRVADAIPAGRNDDSASRAAQSPR